MLQTDVQTDRRTDGRTDTGEYITSLLEVANATRAVSGRTTAGKNERNTVMSVNHANPDHVGKRRLLTRRNVLILLIELFALPSLPVALKAPASAAPTLVAAHEYA